MAAEFIGELIFEVLPDWLRGVTVESSPPQDPTILYWVTAILLIGTCIVMFAITYVPPSFLYAFAKKDGSLDVVEGQQICWTLGRKYYSVDWTNPVTDQVEDQSKLYVSKSFTHRFEIINDANRTYLIRIAVYFTLNKLAFEAEEPLLALRDVVVSTAEKHFRNWSEDVELTHQIDWQKTPYGKKLKKAMRKREIKFATVDLFQIHTKRQKFGKVVG